MKKNKEINQSRREVRVEYRGEEIGYIPNNTIGDDTLEDIMNKLVSITDVSGAAIMRTNGSVISWRSRDNGNNDKPKEYFDFIKEYMSNSYQKDMHYHNEGLFMESIVDYNGSKLLTSRIKQDIILLLVLDKRAYLGLTMLNIEGCLQDIDSALDSSCIWDYETPG